MASDHARDLNVSIGLLFDIGAPALETYMDASLRRDNFNFFDSVAVLILNLFLDL